MRVDLLCCVWIYRFEYSTWILSGVEHSGAVAVDDGGRTFCCYTEPEKFKKHIVEEKASVIKAYVVGKGEKKEFDLTLGELTDEERQIILKGCLINYNRV